MTLSRKQEQEEKRRLYREQEGCCAGCGWELPEHSLTIDHIVPKSKGGTDDPANLQLLCSSCNPTKGDRDMEYLEERLRELSKDAPDRMDLPILASAPWLEIRKSDGGEFVLTEVLVGDVIPFDDHVLIDGERYECEVGYFPITILNASNGQLETYHIQGLALPYHDVFDGVKERFAHVKVEFSIVVRVPKGIWRYPPYSFYWHRDHPTGSIEPCDVIRPSEDPRMHPKFYPQNTKGVGDGKEA